MPIEVDELGTQRFGLVSAKTIDDAAPPVELNSAAHELGVKMLTTRVNCADHDRVHAMEADGHQLMDTLVYYRRSLDAPAGPILLNDGLTVTLATPEDSDAVGKIARSAFHDYFGHFHTDPKISTVASDEVYTDWSERCTRESCLSNPTFLAQSAKETLGFLSMTEKQSDQWEILLNAVIPKAQGDGIYGCLLDTAINHARANLPGTSAAFILTSTQLINFKVQKIWMRRGFYPYTALHTFHKWF